MPGEVHALMGQNGAGKSTLIKVLTGVYPPDEGSVLLEGKAVHPATPLDAQHLGISTVYQEINLCPNLSVAENIFIGRYPRKGPAIDWKTMRTNAEELLGRLSVYIDVTQLLSAYSVAIQQMVAIARAISISCRILILDEPTSSLDEEEVGMLFSVIRSLRDRGLAILFVTHFLDQTYEIADRITVLRNGELVGEYMASALPKFDLITRMVGREIGESSFVKAKATDASANAMASPRRTFLTARGLGRRGSIQPLDLVLLDTDPAKRKTPRLDRIYAVSLLSGSGLRRCGLAGTSLLMSSDNLRWRDSKPAEIRLEGIDILSIIRGEVVWVGREL